MLATPSLTISSKRSAFLPRVSAIDLIKLAASLVILIPNVSGKSPPVIVTGLAAPIFVPGAITAKLAAAVIKVPADPALAPCGLTYTTDGTLDSRNSLTICRVASSSPPGVFKDNTSNFAFSDSALSNPLAIKLAVWILMRPSNSRKTPCFFSAAFTLLIVLRNSPRTPINNKTLGIVLNFIGRFIN